jgi:hypothetical protein
MFLREMHMRYGDTKKCPKVGHFIFHFALFWCERGWGCGLARMQRKEAPGGKQFGSDIANFKRVFLSNCRPANSMPPGMRTA